MGFEIHPWKLAQRSMNQEHLLFAGNGHMGLYGSLEEHCSGTGVCIAGVTDAVCLHGIQVEVDGEPLDLASNVTFNRELDMHTGMLVRSCTVPTAKGNVRIRTERFVSMAQKELLGILYEITPDYDAHICLKPFLSTQTEENPWKWFAEEETEDGMALLAGKEGLSIGAAMSCWMDGLEAGEHRLERGYAESCYAALVPANETVSLEKYALCFTSREYDEKVLTTLALRAASRARELGYYELRDDHAAAWKKRWADCDVCIDGDDAAQQSIRYALFRLMGAWQGEDGRLPVEISENALPVYMALYGQEAAAELLSDGSLYPDNIAVAHAYFRYAASTGDYAWLRREGLHVLHAVAQFFIERTEYDEARQKYVYGDGWYSNRMAAWCIGLFVTQAHRASQERLDQLGVTREKLAYMMDVAQNMDDAGTEDALTGKAGDVLKGLYQLSHLYDAAALRRHYERHTDDDGSWMQCILAARLGFHEKAADLLHQNLSFKPECAAENWLMMTEGLLGMQTMDGLSLSPFLPNGWRGYSVRMHYRGAHLQISVRPKQVCAELLDGAPIQINLCGDVIRLTDRVVHML